MIPLRIPKWIEPHMFSYEDYTRVDPQVLDRIREGLKKFRPDNTQPDVSVVMPVWNEEKDILRTLSSISAIQTRYKTELILINNNSTDRTAELLDSMGVFYIDEPRQGIGISRQTGLEKARGRILFNADADTYYPPAWIDVLAGHLEEHADCVVAHSTYAFLPPPERSRAPFVFYESMIRVSHYLRGRSREHLHVFGFNFACRTEQARKVGGFDLTKDRGEDGVLAFDLKKFGKVHQLKKADACVWTIPRRVLGDGGISGALKIRVRKEFGRLHEYILRKEIKR